MLESSMILHKLTEYLSLIFFVYFAKSWFLPFKISIILYSPNHFVNSQVSSWFSTTKGIDFEEMRHD